MNTDEAADRLRRLQQHYDENKQWPAPTGGYTQNDRQDVSIDPQLQHDRAPSSFTSSSSSDVFGNTSQLPRIGIRSLPSPNITNATIDDAYVAFIFYCNPAIPLDTDASELRIGFRAPPKSDGKQFSIFTLFELIRKLELKELKTWVQLALELGVEPPALGKGQSAQKVQQYAVRLKRWMHAMHVDAFFEFLLGKPHAYWTQVPAVNGTPSEFGRDGVPPEEDLALRALLPEMRPKRGRRPGEGTAAMASKRQRLTDETDADSDRADDRSHDDSRGPSRSARHSPTLSEDFARARASLRGDMTPATAQPGSSSIDRFNAVHRTVSSSEMSYPQSAITPSTNNPFSAYPDEPLSAITPSRPRKRHGPAVSSAWPAINPTAGKLRGRPPSNRIVSDGPFSTFPANPNAKAGPTINLRDPTPTGTPIVDNSEPRHSAFPFHDIVAPNKPAKPSRLHLQVPKRVGGPVRLATPPPLFASPDGRSATSPSIEGDNNNTSSFPSIHCDIHPCQNDTDSRFQTRSSNFTQLSYLPGPDNSTSTYDTDPVNLTQHSTDKLPQSSRQITPGPAVQEQANPPPTEEDSTNVAEIQVVCTQHIISSEWFDMNGASTIGEIDEANRIVKQIIREMSVETASKEMFLLSLAALAGSSSLVTGMKIWRLEDNGKSTAYDLKWTMKFGVIEGSFQKRLEVVNLTPDEVERLSGIRKEVDDGDHSAAVWKTKYLEMQAKVHERDQTLKNVMANIVSAMGRKMYKH